MIVSVLIWVLLAMAASLIGAELAGWGDRLQILILRRASKALPQQHAERYLEEWLAELKELPQAPITRLIWVGSIWLHRGGVSRALGSRAPRPRPLAMTLKGGIDRTVAGLALLLYAPIFLVIAVIVRLTSRGPAMSRQTRVGINGNTFTIMKFRTTMRDDPRVTRVGRVLRRFSLDEMPQLINVVTGSMSLVGPRPPLPSEAAQYSDDERRRLLVKPGLTGIAQVSGWSDLNWDQSRRLDLIYVDHWSPTLDLYILCKTFVIGLLPKRPRRRS